MAEWQRLAPQLTARGVLDVGSRETFAEYCRITSDLKRWRTQLAEAGDYIETKSGYCQAHPLVSMINTGSLRALRYQRQLGLGPASRNAVSMKAPEEADKFDEWQNRRK